MVGSLRPLARYAAVALLIVVGSAGALAASLQSEAPRTGGSASPSGPPLAPDRHALARQLGTPRFAYWREERDGGRRLWVSDGQGSRRWTIGPAAMRGETRHTRWSPDGTAIAYVMGEKDLVVAMLDGESARLPAWRDQGTDEARRILGLAWSADGRRIATTQRQGSGSTSPTDVFVTDVDGTGAWVQATAAGDVHVAGWASSDELLVETRNGLVGVLRIGEPDAIRPLTGMPAVSPRIDPDGRIVFGAGHYVQDELRERPVAIGQVWSAAPGDAPRQEATGAMQERFRVEGRWPDGRFILSVAGGMKLSGAESGRTGNLPFLAGTIRRVVVAPDGTAAYGITDDRILQLHLDLAVRLPAAPEAAAVVLDEAHEADIWFPRATAVLGSWRGAFSERVPARYAFVHGGRIWISEPDGQPRAVHTADARGSWFRQPRWSPDGERLLTAETVRTGTREQHVVLVLDRSGRVTRLAGLGQAASRSWVSSLAWSPEGDRVAIAFGLYGAEGEGSQVALIGLDGTERGARIAGSELAWVESGLFVLGNGRLDAAYRGVRVGQTIELVVDGERRTITDADRLAQDARSGVANGMRAGLGQLAASADGSHLSAVLYRIGEDGGRRQQSLAIVRTRDGAARSFHTWDPGEGGIGDVEWSPRGALIGHTASAAGPGGPGTAWTSSAVVRDASGRVLTETEGRFAGWSPDAAWFYVYRPAGLHAYRVDGSDDVWIGPIGTRVVTTRP